jgi:hypothetical protein
MYMAILRKCVWTTDSCVNAIQAKGHAASVVHQKGPDPFLKSAARD